MWTSPNPQYSYSRSPSLGMTCDVYQVYISRIPGIIVATGFFLTNLYLLTNKFHYDFLKQRSLYLLPCHWLPHTYLSLIDSFACSWWLFCFLDKMIDIVHTVRRKLTVVHTFQTLAPYACCHVYCCLFTQSYLVNFCGSSILIRVKYHVYPLHLLSISADKCPPSVSCLLLIRKTCFRIHLNPPFHTRKISQRNTKGHV